MRNRFSLSLITLIVAFSLKAVAQDFAIIGGHVKDSSNFDMIVNAYMYPLDLIEGNSVSLVASLNGNNDFKTQIGFNRPFYVRYLDHKKLLKGTYVLPGDMIWLTIADGATSLSGSNKKLITFLNKLEPIFENAEKELSDTAIFKTMGRDEVVKYLRARRNKQRQAVVEYFIGLPPLQMEMRRLLEAEINYSYGLKLLRYARSSGKDKRFALRYKEYMAAIEEVIASDPDAMLSTAYAQFIYELPFTIWHSEINWGMTDKPPYAQLVADEFIVRDSLAQKYFDGEVYELALYAILLDAVKDAAKVKGQPGFNSAYAKADNTINNLGKSFTNRLYYSRIKARLEELNEPERVVEPVKKKPVKKR